MLPADIAVARQQWALLLSRFRSGQVRLVNEQRDLVQLEQLPALRFLQGSDNRAIAIERRLGKALARLANHATVCDGMMDFAKFHQAVNSPQPATTE